MGSGKSRINCYPNPEEENEAESGEKTEAPITGSPDTLQAKIRELQKKYEDSQTALAAQSKVSKTLEQQLDIAGETAKLQGGSLAISATMLKFQKEGTGKATKKKVTFMKTDMGECILEWKNENGSDIKQMTVTGVTTDPTSINTKKIKEDEAVRLLIVMCESKKIPLLCDTTETRDKWSRVISSSLGLLP